MEKEQRDEEETGKTTAGAFSISFGEKEQIFAFDGHPDAKPIHISVKFLHVAFLKSDPTKKIVGLLDQFGKHLSADADFIAVPQQEICYELLVKEALDLVKLSLLVSEKRYDLSGGKYGRAGQYCYIAPNGTKVVSTNKASEQGGIRNLFDPSKFLCFSAEGESGSLTIHFPSRPIYVTRVVVGSRVLPEILRGGGDCSNIVHLRRKSNYNILVWDKTLSNWVESVPLVDTSTHPDPGLETSHPIGELLDKLQIFLTSDGEDPGVILGSLSIYVQ